MKIRNILAILDEMAPLAYAEDFDNVGLLVGDADIEATGILVCHDALETVIDEAISKNCNLVVCFHPILFSGLKKITGANYVERSILKAIKNDIAIYAVHTALDNHKNGVNKIFCDALGLVNTKILVPKKDFIHKLVTFAPTSNADSVRQALFDAGAGKIGNYENCSFNSNGIGTYQGNEDSNPKIGQKHEFVSADETKIEVTFEKHLQSKILKALFGSHPYEEVAYEIYELKNEHQNIGLGMIGELETARTEREFLQLVSDAMQAEGIRHSEYRNKNVKKVAVLGGSGSFAISAAKRAGADAFVTSDLKYHQFYEAENRLLLLDIGHFESERFTKNYMLDFLKEKIPNFAIILSEVNTNPVKYF
ncbi:Nif3-like dinuclear metal center hexameric protein [Flavobacterium sp. MAH-1]|uniref:GTP cyclohydrolase 1 type 2 homolog n=1 Tax=Flavobacterium agri TaxID=2743471 RepID=A0A7Y8Y1S2_9FLAO|nr:Nif3-like dinuclear metal center hexameric protein [Flavobacterium agri]NUY80982.1 Nif3-like dinuclear metal center hexameric protein [Flavobacterium agri]NYA71006.1 Nif3-like dinuclear metal center hexameric protein [Flavobacterium agri]